MDTINPRHLIPLDAVVRHGSFAAAAHELACTQSAVSQQIAEIERHPRRCVAPTPLDSDSDSSRLLKVSGMFWSKHFHRVSVRPFAPQRARRALNLSDQGHSHFLRRTGLIRRRAGLGQDSQSFTSSRRGTLCFDDTCGDLHDPRTLGLP